MEKCPKCHGSAWKCRQTCFLPILSTWPAAAKDLAQDRRRRKVAPERACRHALLEWSHRLLSRRSGGWRSSILYPCRRSSARCRVVEEVIAERVKWSNPMAFQDTLLLLSLATRRPDQQSTIRTKQRKGKADTGTHTAESVQSMRGLLQLLRR